MEAYGLKDTSARTHNVKLSKLLDGGIEGCPQLSPVGHVCLVEVNMWALVFAIFSE